MLIIGRRVQESIIIDDQIEIVISEISGDRVQLAIKAPTEVRIWRKELYETSKLNQQANQSAAGKDLQDFAKALREKQLPQQIAETDDKPK